MVKHERQYVMVFRNDYNWNDEEQKAVGFQIGVAYSDDGISNWHVHPKPIIEFQSGVGDDVLGSYDPRVTVLEGRIYITYAMYTKHGYRGTIARTDDFESIEIISSVVPDNRDIILFPERIHNLYWRLERPFPIDSRSPFVCRGCALRQRATRRGELARPHGTWLAFAVPCGRYRPRAR